MAIKEINVNDGDVIELQPIDIIWPGIRLNLPTGMDEVDLRTEDAAALRDALEELLDGGEG